MARARVEIEVLDPRDAAQQIEKIAAAEARLKSSMDAGRISAEQYQRSTERLRVTKKTLQDATTGAGAAVGQLTGAQRQAAAAAQLLGQQLGVNLPRAMQTLIVRNQLLARSITAAFAAGAVLFFISNIENVIKRVEELGTKIDLLAARGLARLPLIGGFFKDIAQAADDAKKAEEGLKKQQEILGDIRQLNLQTLLVGLKEEQRLRVQMKFALGDIDKQIKETGRSEIFYQDLRNKKLAIEQFYRAQINDELRKQAELIQKQKLEVQANFLDLINEQLLKGRNLLISIAKLPAPFIIPELDPKVAAGVVAANEKIMELERELALERVALSGNTVQQMLLQEAFRAEETIKELKKIGATDEQIQAARRLLHEQTSIKIAQANQQAFQQMSTQIESFFTQVFLTARSFGDVWKQLLQQIYRLFVTMVSQMVARWIMGMRQMQGAAAGGGGGAGGFLGSLLGGLFGLGGGGGLLQSIGLGPGGTARTFPSAAARLFPGAGFSVTGATNLAGILPGSTVAGTLTGPVATGGGGATATALSRFGPLQGLTGLLGLGGITAGMGLLSSGISGGSPLRGALGGAALGFGGALAIGSMLGAPLAIGLAAGIVPGIILAAVGALLSALARGKKKRQASRIAEAGFEEMQKVVEQFKKFQVDYEAALGGVGAIWEQMQAAWSQLGKSILKRSVRGEQPEFDQIVRQIKEIQKARELRGALGIWTAIPEFASGGFVDQFRAINATSGRLLAFLHQGEAVLNARAVQRLGRGFVEQVNRTPSFQAGGVVGSARGVGGVTVNFEPGAIVISAPVADPNALARQLARPIKREIERELRDRGLTLGS